MGMGVKLGNRPSVHAFFISNQLSQCTGESSDQIALTLNSAFMYFLMQTSKLIWLGFRDR